MELKGLNMSIYPEKDESDKYNLLQEKTFKSGVFQKKTNKWIER